MDGHGRRRGMIGLGKSYMRGSRREKIVRPYNTVAFLSSTPVMNALSSGGSIVSTDSVLIDIGTRRHQTSADFWKTRYQSYIDDISHLK